MSVVSTNTASRSVHANARRSLSDYLALWRQRRQLARLDSHALDDMGLSRADVRRETKRAIWDVPANWRA